VADPVGFALSNTPIYQAPQPPQRNYFPYLGRAVVVIDGHEYYEWESVQVRAAITENTRTCRLTTSEQTPTPTSNSAFRIMPGMKCTVFLDGYLAMTGMVVTRQVFYNADQHSVEIQAQGAWGIGATSSIVSQTHEFNNIDLKQLAQTLGAPFGVGVEGQAVTPQKFKRISVTPGETPFELLEKYARATGTPMSETPGGNINLGWGGGTAVAIEGYNILEGREVIHSLQGTGGGGDQPQGVEPGSGSEQPISGDQEGGPGEGTDFNSMGQRPGTDDDWGAKANQNSGEQPGITNDFSPGYNPKVQASEVPADSQDQMKSRSGMEAMYSDMLQYWVTLKLLTWQRKGKAPPSGGIWYPGDTVTVNSPMLVLDGQALVLTAVTWMQDNTGGTVSVIELQNQKAMRNAGTVPGVAPSSTAPQQPLTPEGSPQPEQTPPAEENLPPGRSVRTWSRR